MTEPFYEIPVQPFEFEGLILQVKYHLFSTNCCISRIKTLTLRTLVHQNCRARITHLYDATVKRTCK